MTSNQFRLWRIAVGLNQSECAKLFRVSQQAISQWETVRLPKKIDAKMKDARIKRLSEINRSF